MTDIYHITHITNLPSIISNGGLFCDNGCVKRGVVLTGIAHSNIKQRRAQKAVPLPPGGTLADFVPFYFGPRTPMLCAIHTGTVKGYQGGQQAVLHLVSSCTAVAAVPLPFVYTDGHAEMNFSTFESDLVKLPQVVDLPLMTSVWWNDTLADPDRKRRRQAEFLVHDFFPWHLVDSIGVYDATVAAQVTQLLSGAAHKPLVNVCAGWYY